MIQHPKTANYRAYFIDNATNTIYYVRITKNEYIDLSTCGFQCFRASRDGFSEYSVKTSDGAIWSMYMSGRNPKKLKTPKVKKG